MDIRTKFVFTLVAVALASMFFFGVVANRTAEDQFRARTAEQLAGLAAFKEEVVAQVAAGWSDRVALVASRTQLRLSLAEFNRSGDPAAAERMGRILDDARSGSTLFEALWVEDREGRWVAGSGEVAAPGSPDLGPEAPHDDPGGIRFGGVAFRDGGFPVARYTAELSLDDEILGVLHALVDIREIEELSDDYTGLGETGETIVVARDGDGSFRVLHPLRFPQPGSDVAGFRVEADHAVARSLAGGEVGFTGEFEDYRGEPVFMATRIVSGTGWGVVVKVDQAEQELPILDFRRRVTRAALSLAAFGILFGVFVGMRVAQPIHHMAETAERIAGGDLTARTGLEREDEVGMLARNFDGMAAALESQVGLLSEYRKFFDVSLDMLCIAGTDGFFKRINQAFVRELGWPEEELLRRPFVELVHPDDVGPTLAEIEKLAGGTPTIRFANRFLCSDGSYKWLRWNAYPEPDTGRLYAIARRTTTPEEAS